MNTFTRLESFSNPNSNPKLKPTKDTKTAGLAIIAEDTGRVLMLQRQNSPKKSGGKWEFPGGHIENGEAHHEAAIREWEEETGIKFPPNGKWNDLHWLSPDTKYMGLIYKIPHESDIEINPPKSRRVLNPDDPNHENMETVAWWDPKDLIENPALREEAHSTPWHILAAIQEFSNDCHDEKGEFCETGGEGSVSLQWDKALKNSTSDPGKGNYWITQDGKFAPVKDHNDVFAGGPRDWTPFKTFTEKTGAVRVVVGNKDLVVEAFTPMTQEQRESLAEIASQKGTLTIGVRGAKVFPYQNTVRDVDYDRALQEIEKANRAVKGQEVPAGKSFASNSFTLLHTFYNENHDEKGRFAPSESSGGTATNTEPETKTKPEDIRNFGFEDWPKSRATAVLTTVANLKDKYPGVEDNAILSVNASNRIGNIASELGALAAVDSHAPTHIDIAPEMKSQAWLKENSVDYTVSKASLEDTITHEFGHIVELALPPNLRTELAAPFLKAIESSFDLEDGKGDGKEFLNLTHTVSEYAGDNVSEGIAEAFLQHEKGIHNEYSDHVGAVLAKWKEARGTK